MDTDRFLVATEVRIDSYYPVENKCLPSLLIGSFLPEEECEFEFIQIDGQENNTYEINVMVYFKPGE